MPHFKVEILAHWTSSKELENILEEYYQNGWELCGVYNHIYIFKNVCQKQ